MEGTKMKLTFGPFWVVQNGPTTLQTYKQIA